MTSALTALRLYHAAPDRALASAGREPLVKRETDYFLSHISKVKSAKDFVSDQRLFAYAMKAYG